MSTTNLSITKSLLAKLLAGENINVVHRRVSTAAFELKTRTLYLPIWENMDGELYDLLGGHEVGHALYTPVEGWHSSIHDKDGKFLGSFKNVLNIVEDARIEKLIKRKYPGLAKSFVSGYRTLFDRDFFGVKELRDLSKLNILDRINLYAKCGAFLVVPFNDEERELVREVENTETWEQVVDVAKRLFDRAKQDQQEQQQEQQQAQQNFDDLTEELLREFEEQDGETQELDLSDDGEEDQEDSKSSQSDSTDEESEDEETTAGKNGEDSEEESGASDEDSEEESDDKEESNASAGGDEESEDGKSDEEEQAPGANDGAGEEGETSNEPESITDKMFRERERELIADGVEVFTYNLPKPMLDRIIVPHRVFMDNFYEQLEACQKLAGKNDPIVSTAAKRFSEKNRLYINLLVKEFEMRKNARQYARTTVARTGELDMGKLHTYRYSNDLFRKISIVEKGKSHGMIMYVDMSGSMSDCFGSTMEQTLILVEFCRRVNIPFDVYGFSDRKEFLIAMRNKKKLNSGFIGDKFQKLNSDTYSIASEGFHLIHYISSQLQGAAYRRAADAMATIAMNWKNRMYPRTYLNWELMGVELGGTPFTQTVMASRPMIEKFKIDNKVDITNVIYLTDGDGTGCFKFTDVKGVPYTAEGKPKIEQIVYLVDQKTRHRIQLVGNQYGSQLEKQHQTALTEFVRETTGCKHIGFYIGDSNSIKGYIRSNVIMDEVANANMEKQWRKNGYYSAPMIGYDMYYFVKQSDLNITESDYILTEDMSCKKIAKVFTDAQDDKRKHRILVSKFAQDIAA